MASSSDAGELSIHAHVLAPASASACGQLTGMESRLEDSDSVILHESQHQPVFPIPRVRSQLSIQAADLEDRERVHLNAPSTYAAASSFPHCRDRETGVLYD